MRLTKIKITILAFSFIFLVFGLSGYVGTADAQIPPKRSTMGGEILNAYFDNVGNLILLISTDMILANVNNSRHVGGYLTKYNFGELFAIGGFIVAVSLSIDLESAKSVYTLGELSGGGGRSWEQTLLASSISPFLGGAVGLLYGGVVENEPLMGGIIGFALGSMISPIAATIGYDRAQPMKPDEQQRRFGQGYNPIPRGTLDSSPMGTSYFAVTLFQKRF